MKAGDAFVSKRAQQPDAADSEDRFLAQPVGVVAAIEGTGERALGSGIFGKIRVEKVDGYGLPGAAHHRVAPSPNAHVSSAKVHGNDRIKRFENAFGFPGFRRFALPPLRVQMLVEVPAPWKQSNSVDREPAVGGGTQ